jgi:hypothetical protein
MSNTSGYPSIPTVLTGDGEDWSKEKDGKRFD